MPYYNSNGENALRGLDEWLTTEPDYDRYTEPENLDAGWDNSLEEAAEAAAANEQYERWREDYREEWGEYPPEPDEPADAD